jgi:hypothetical protein
MWADTGNVHIGAGGQQNPPFLSASEYFHPIPHLGARPLSRLFFLLPPGGISPVSNTPFSPARVSRARRWFLFTPISLGDPKLRRLGPCVGYLLVRYRFCVCLARLC